MRKMLIVSTTALMVAALVIPAITTPAHADRRGRGIAAGVVLGVAAAALIANSSRANADERRWARQCNRLYNRCRDGSYSACDRFEANGCSE